MPYYKRRKKCISKDDKIDFIDKTGEKFTEFFVVHKPFKDWIKQTYNLSDKEYTEKEDEIFLEDAYKKSPWYMNTAMTLPINIHLKL